MLQHAFILKVQVLADVLEPLQRMCTLSAASLSLSESVTIPASSMRPH
jgi:hypothetical protein